MTDKSELAHATRQECLKISCGLWRKLFDEFSIESFSIHRLSEMPTEKLQHMLSRAIELGKQ